MVRASSFVASIIMAAGCAAQAGGPGETDSRQDGLTETFALTTEQHRLEAQKLAISLGRASTADRVDTIPSLTATLPSDAGTKCYLVDKGPPKTMHEVNCDEIVIVHTDD